MKKKNIALVLAALMAAAAVTGCGGGANARETKQVTVAKEGYPVVDEKITINAVGYGDPGGGEWEEFPIFKELEEKTNVEVNWTTVSGDGADEKLNLLLASSKELPDAVFSGLSTTKIATYAEKGLIRPIEDLIDGGYAPNLKKILDENPEIRKAITMPDGHIYAVPSINEDEEPVMTTTLNINKDWCDALGVKVEDIKTVDDFKNLMDRFVNEDPNGNGEKDEIGFTLEPVAPYHVWNGDANFSGMWGISTDYDPIMVKDGEIVCSVIQPEYKEYIIWFRDMYTGGLIDKECFTHDHNQYMAKIDSGNVGAYLTNGPVTSAQANFVAIAPLEGPAGAHWGSLDFSIDKGRGLITTTNPYPEATMRFIDSFYEPETSLNLRYGVYLQASGEQYEILPTESGKPAQAPGSYVATNLSKEVTEKYVVKTEEQIQGAERKELYGPYLLEPLPLMNYTPEESSDLSSLSADLTKVISEQKAKWCTGQGDIETEWDSYIESLNKMGLEKYMEIQNTAYDRYMGS